MAVATAVDEYNTFSEDEKKQFRSAVGLPPPIGIGLNIVWIILVSVLGIIAVVALVFAFILASDDKDVGFVAGVVGVAVGALGGMAAPQPRSTA